MTAVTSIIGYRSLYPKLITGLMGLSHNVVQATAQKQVYFVTRALTHEKIQSIWRGYLVRSASVGSHIRRHGNPTSPSPHSARHYSLAKAARQMDPAGRKRYIVPLQFPPIYMYIVIMTCLPSSKKPYGHDISCLSLIIPQHRHPHIPPVIIRLRRPRGKWIPRDGNDISFPYNFRHSICISL